ncbi:cysteine-rich with EGF-like domain protein 2 [Homalodisca vitripennis]|uniref:cysteine-rich with EGF-like domain protein 2 n=1 Tax=Homalodisca vitripennis TaxID=197043 RepID=UPI001EE9D9E8|nr:cysteine-rich with EGF-like domain protein 2 [Homalodisca vitripennis]
MQVKLLIFLSVNFVFAYWLKSVWSEKTNKQVKLTSLKLPACQACKMLVGSFYSELHLINNLSNDKTPENDESVSYTVEVFQEVFTNLCKEDRAKDQCHTLADKCKDYLQNWWLKHKADSPDLLNYLCIEKLNYCCPNGHYGPQCNPCPGYPDRVCNNNGKCKGNGTRKGNGQCSCDVGYAGKICEDCASSYYVSYKDDNKMLCARCHSACVDDCTQAGTKGCLQCKEGWRLDKLKGCMDVNECFNKRSPCKRNEFCVNNEGSYSCFVCDPSCDTCTGDGPDMCEKCAPGFVLKDNLCVNEKNYVSYSDVTRYLTYVGLCFATYIVFQNSPWAASLIGICVAIYVTVSEYMLGTLTSTNFLSFWKALDGLENLWRNDL